MVTVKLPSYDTKIYMKEYEIEKKKKKKKKRKKKKKKKKSHP